MWSLTRQACSSKECLGEDFVPTHLLRPVKGPRRLSKFRDYPCPSLSSKTERMEAGGDGSAALNADFTADQGKQHPSVPDRRWLCLPRQVKGMLTTSTNMGHREELLLHLAVLTAITRGLAADRMAAESISPIRAMVPLMKLFDVSVPHFCYGLCLYIKNDPVALARMWTLTWSLVLCLHSFDHMSGTVPWGQHSWHCDFVYAWILYAWWFLSPIKSLHTLGITGSIKALLKSGSLFPFP